jgi:hypothetical protein
MFLIHFTFPTQRKEPLDDALHVRFATRLTEVERVNDADRDEAWKRSFFIPLAPDIATKATED